MAARPANCDWGEIRRQWESATISTCELAVQHGITESAIRQRAKRGDWQRALSERVDAALDRALIEDIGASQKSKLRPKLRFHPRTKLHERDELADTATVVAAVGAQTKVVRGHREKLEVQIDLVNTLIGELALVSNNLTSLEEFAYQQAAEIQDGGARARMLKAFKQAMSLSERASAARNLASCMSHLVPLHRQAYGIRDKGAEEENAKRPMVRLFLGGAAAKV